MPLSKRLAAEVLGTFWLVFGGCGSAVFFPDDRRDYERLSVFLDGELPPRGSA